MKTKEDIFKSRVNKNGRIMVGMSDQCWEFMPKSSKANRRLSFNLGNGKILSASLCGFLYFTGSLPEHRIFSLCKNTLCVRPSHFTHDYGIAHFGEFYKDEVRYKYCPICKLAFPKTREYFYFMGNGTLTSCKTCALDKVKSDRAKHWARTLRNEISRRHNQTGIEVSIDEEFILKLYEVQGGRCYWSGLEMIPSQINKYPFQPSLDRLDNKRGYTADNVVLCCFSMNMGRNSIPKHLFEEFILKIKHEGIHTSLWK